MSLPDPIEIVPLTGHVKAEITVPGSKSITNRALILAALAEGETVLKGALWSEDTQIMVEALLTLGFDVKVEDDPEEFCNRTITVWGFGGRIPRGGSAEEPVEIFVGNAGTAARFLSAMVCLGSDAYRLSGVPRMHERPQAALFKALRELGYRVDSPNDKLPATIFGSSRREEAPSGKAEGGKRKAETEKRACTVSIEESSQFASALLLSAKTGNWEIKIEGENAEESPYVVMTSKLIEVFPKSGGSFQIEPDASSGSYFLVAVQGKIEQAKGEASETSAWFCGEISPSVTVLHWPKSGWQIDQQFQRFATMFAGSIFSNMAVKFLGIEAQIEKSLGANWRELTAGQYQKYSDDYQQEHGPTKFSRLSDLGDSIMTAIVVAPQLHYPVQFTDLGRLRVQECERVVALRTELTKCGAKVVEEGDTLTVYPSELHGAEIETYNDHRMAMCFAILGLKVPGIKIQNPACVKKTFPNFYQKLATPPPHGLGAVILDGKTGRKLEMDELFAD